MATMISTVRAEPLAETFGIRLEGSGDIGRIDSGQLLEAYKSSGTVLLTGFDADLEGFESLTRQHTRDFVTIKTGHKQGVGDDASTQTLLYMADTLVPLHQELGYSPRTPDILWLYCMAPASERGETLLCDGAELWDRLQSETQALFKQQPVTYQYRQAPTRILDIFLGDTAGDDSLPQGLRLDRNADGTVDLDYTIPAVAPAKHSPEHDVFANSLLIETGTTRFADGSQIDPEVRRELDRAAAQVTFLHAWQPGDVLMIDNRRMMHGRAAYDDPSRRVVSRIGNDAF